MTRTIQASFRAIWRGELPGSDVTCFCVEEELERQGESRRPSAPPRAGLDDLAYVIYTSGSTGKPKGVEVTLRGVTNFLQAMRSEPGLGPGETMLALTTLSFDISVAEVFLPLTVGARIVLVSRDVAADPFALREVIDRTRPSLLQATPATWRMLIDAGWEGRSDARLMVGGEALSPELAELLLARSAQVWNMYGPTEATVWATLWRVESGRRILIGRPLANTTAYVLDPALEARPIGVPGELYLGGVQLARGYHGRPELSADKFIPDQFSGADGRLYRTGDLARFLPDGNIEFLGRIDHQVKIRGFRIELGEIESVLTEETSVAGAVVIAREDGGDKYLAAYVISQPLEPFSAERLRTHLRSRLPEYMIPARFVSLDEFPLTPNGKIDRLALPKPNTPSTGASIEACRDSIEQGMVDIWESLLGVQPVRPGDNFFELGGNSLLAVRVMVEIEKVWGKRLPIVALFESPSIRQLADMIRSAGEAPEFSCVVPIQTEGEHAPLFLIHGLGGNVLGYHALASHLSPVQPIYGVQAVGIDGKQPPLDNIPQMARRYIEEIRRVQPQGPYYLGGLSLGGAIALEIALLLREQGEQVAALIMLDAYAYGVEKLASTGSRLAARFSTTLRRLALHARNLAAVQDPFSYIRKKARTLRKRAMWRLGSQHYKNFIPGVDELPVNYNAVAHAAWTAAMRYVPRPYEGRVLVLRAKDEPFLRHNDPTLGWSALVRSGLTVREVQGDHMNLLVEPNVQDTASQILDYMRSISERVQYAVRGRSGSTGSIDTVGVAAQQTPQ